MHLESFGIETGDPDRPYVSRVTVGTRKRRDILHERRAPSLDEAQKQADDWICEWSARIQGALEDETVEEAAARSARLETYGKLPDLPWAPEGWPYVTDRPRTIKPASSDEVHSDFSRPAETTVAGLRKTIRARVQQVVGAARSAGIDVVGVRVWPDGSVAAFDARSSFIPPTTAPRHAAVNGKCNSSD